MQHLQKHSAIRKISRKSVLTISVIGLVVATVATGSIAAAHNQSDNPEIPPKNDTQSNQTPESASNSESGSTPDASPDVTGGASNSSKNETTVTVNGQTVHTEGDVALDKSYTTDDGSSHVSISIHNSSQSAQGTSQNTEHDMN